MPTVTLPSGKKRKFPYNAVGKAKMNPGPKMEKKMSSSY